MITASLGKGRGSLRGWARPPVGHGQIVELTAMTRRVAHQHDELGVRLPAQGVDFLQRTKHILCFVVAPQGRQSVQLHIATGTKQNMKTPWPQPPGCVDWSSQHSYMDSYPSRPHGHSKNRREETRRTKNEQTYKTLGGGGGLYMTAL